MATCIIRKPYKTLGVRWQASVSDSWIYGASLKDPKIPAVVNLGDLTIPRGQDEKGSAIVVCASTRIKSVTLLCKYETVNGELIFSEPILWKGFTFSTWLDELWGIQ